MKTIIYCKPTSKGIHSFYVAIGNERFFLFEQAYRKGVEQYYGNGKLIDDALNFSKAHNDYAITRTMTKLPMYLQYVEMEYGMKILKKTRRLNRNSKAQCRVSGRYLQMLNNENADLY